MSTRSAPARSARRAVGASVKAVTTTMDACASWRSLDVATMPSHPGVPQSERMMAQVAVERAQRLIPLEQLLAVACLAHLETSRVSACSRRALSQSRVVVGDERVPVGDSGSGHSTTSYSTIVPFGATVQEAVGSDDSSERNFRLAGSEVTSTSPPWARAIPHGRCTDQAPRPASSRRRVRTAGRARLSARKGCPRHHFPRQLRRGQARCARRSAIRPAPYLMALSSKLDSACCKRAPSQRPVTCGGSSRAERHFRVRESEVVQQLAAKRAQVELCRAGG